MVKHKFNLVGNTFNYSDAPRCARLLMLNYEPLDQGCLDQVALDDAVNRARLSNLGFPENKVIPGEEAKPAEGPSPQFFNPPRDRYVLGWYHARRRVYFNMTEPASFGNFVIFDTT